ncbi:MAG: hypothetical protein KatS3mg009_1649 [Acidimicrobiia bacterium]|nr:MAG: hypothetical protein KatS3mg009_1649 [Acidimicrobiia bacterium]
MEVAGDALAVLGEREALVGLHQLLGGLAVLGDVAHDRDHEPLPRDGQGAQADLDRELLTRAAPAPQVEPRAHRPGAGVRHVLLAVAFVPGPQRLGQEQLHGLPEQLVGLVPEQRAEHRVGEDDAAVAVDDEDAVGRGLDGPQEDLLHPGERDLRR